MPTQHLISLTVNVSDKEREDEEVENFAQYLVEEFRDVEGVEHSGLVPVEHVPENSKSMGGFILGVLKTEVSLEGAKTIFSLLKDLVGSKPIELEVESNGKSLKIKAANYKDLEKSIEAAQQFISS